MRSDESPAPRPTEATSGQDPAGPRFTLAAYTDASDFGGAEASMRSLLIRLDQAIDVTLIGTHTPTLKRIAEGCPRISITTVPVVRKFWDLRSIHRHVRAIRDLGADVLQVNLNNPWAGRYAVLAGILSRTPTIAVEHTVLPLTSRPRKLVKRLLCSRLTAHVAVGEAAAREVERESALATGSVITIRNGVPDVPLDPPSRITDKPTIGTVSRMDSIKGLDVLLRALPHVPDAHLVMLSDGAERRSLESLAEEEKVADRVTFTGWVESARDYLPNFDVVAVPSRTEAFPLVIIEAMLASRPVVASKVGSVSESIADGETGLLVPPGDECALAGALNELISDGGLRRSMGARARARALTQFSMDRMVTSYEQLYARILAAR